MVVSVASGGCCGDLFRLRVSVAAFLVLVMTERWFVRHRQDWIAETLRVFGFINREHLERKFGISTPQASYDLALYMREQPGAITYNKSAKRYEAP